MLRQDAQSAETRFDWIVQFTSAIRNVPFEHRFILPGSCGTKQERSWFLGLGGRPSGRTVWPRLSSLAVRFTCEMSRLGCVTPSAGRDVIDRRLCFLSLLAQAAVWLLEPTFRTSSASNLDQRSYEGRVLPLSDT